MIEKLITITKTAFTIKIPTRNKPPTKRKSISLKSKPNHVVILLIKGTFASGLLNSETYGPIKLNPIISSTEEERKRANNLGNVRFSFPRRSKISKRYLNAILN